MDFSFNQLTRKMQGEKKIATGLLESFLFFFCMKIVLFFSFSQFNQNIYKYSH